VSALTETFIKERPLPGATTSSGLQAEAATGTGPVTVDDAALFMGRFAGGALGSFEATRFATGRKNAIRIEVNGSLGSVAFDFESMNELQVYDATARAEVAGFTRVLVTEPEHPYMAAWWPPGHLIGYEHSFTHEIVDLIGHLAADTDPSPSFADGLQVQRVLAAVQESAADESRWRAVPSSEPAIDAA
jgi:predicted dehydrogenase